MRILIETKELTKTFGSGSGLSTVLENINLNIYDGDFTVIMGASGSGKSTLLYALSGMDKPNGGSIIFDGETDLAKQNTDRLAQFRSKNCGFVFQQVYLVDSLTVLDNVLLGALINNKDKKEALKKSLEILEAVGIPRDHYKKFPAQLSGGQAQRVGVARAAVGRPKVLFADEPTGSLNSQNSKFVLDIFSQLNDSGQTIVMVTHDIVSALRGSRILYLKDGQVKDELALSKYSQDDAKRKQKLLDFLSVQGW